MEFQLQLYLVMGVGGGLIAALILSTAILIYYMVKLNERISRDSYRRWVLMSLLENKPITMSHILNILLLRQSQGNSRINAYNNPALNLDDELHRRFTQYTPEPTIEREKKTKSNKGSVNSQK